MDQDDMLDQAISSMPFKKRSDPVQDELKAEDKQLVDLFGN